VPDGRPPGHVDQLSNRITASQRMLLRRLSSQRQQRRRRQRRQRPEPVRRPEEASYQQPGQEPRSCCRRHSARMLRQKRLKQVWSSSIDTPEILRVKFYGRACYWVFTQISAAILECFAAISYLFRATCSAFNVLESRVGLKVYSCRGVWRILYAGPGRREKM
jgi:hypothetical protein